MAHKRFVAAYLLGVSFLPSLLPAVVMAQDLPADPTVVAGDIRITSPSATQMLMQQGSRYGIVDWGSFSIGQGFGVQVNNGAGATLNRVTGGNLSSILGSLTATGSVYLVNPNGIVVGRTGVVNTGGRFVATTLNMTNADLLNGGDATFAGDSSGFVVNMGQVSSLGGDVALLARHVVNEGTLSAPNGTAGVIAGREILMRDAAVADGLFSVRVGGADSSATDAGAIRAAAAELRAKGGNVYALAGNTDGTIEATGVAKVKGRIFLTAGDSGALQVEKTAKARNADGSGGTLIATGGTVDMAGTLDASGTKGGAVVVKAGGETQFDGQIFASGGEGGFVEVSGGHISFDGQVQTGGGTLLIDPDNIEITFNNSALLTGAVDATILTPTDIQTLLDSGDVIIETNGATGEAGTLAVTSGVFWNTSNSLTLLATGDVLLRNSIQNNSEAGGDLNIVAGWDGSTGAGIGELLAGSFDAGAFDAPALDSQTLFGQSTGLAYSYNGTSALTSGSVFLGYDTATNGIAVGAKSGTTRVYTRNLSITGASAADYTGGFAQLGYNVNGTGDQGTVSGNIQVRATRNVTVVAGPNAQNAAQIGHGGLNQSDVSSGAAATIKGDIAVEAGGDMLVQGGDPGYEAEAYAMIGHGAFDLPTLMATTGTRSGKIDVTVAGDLVIQQGSSSFTDPAWIGHHGAVDAKSDTTMTAKAFYESTAAQTLDDPSAWVNMLALDTYFGDVRLTTTASALRLVGSTSGLDCECDSIASSGHLIVHSAGNLILGSAASSDFHYNNQGSGDLILATDGDVTNNAGSTAIGSLDPLHLGEFGSGIWTIWSDRPDHDSGTMGVLPARLLFFRTTFNPADPLDPMQMVVNTLVYRRMPIIIPKDTTITYGESYTPDGIDMFLEGDGEVITDPSAWGFSLSTPYLDDSVVSVPPSGYIDAGTYANAIVTNVSGSTSAVPTSYALGKGWLTVNQADITVTLADQTKDYDAAGYGLTPTYSGWIGNDDDSLIDATGLSFSYSGGDGSGVNVTAPLDPYIVSALGLAVSSSNYHLVTDDTASLIITPRQLYASIINPIVKTYDGTDAATLTSDDFALDGFVAGQGATVTQTAGTYDSLHVGSTILVSAVLGEGDFTADTGTVLSNYILPVDAFTEDGTINQAQLTASIIGNPSKVYDGSDAATLTDANFQLDGFFGSDGATVGQTSGTYASANASLTNTVTATLADTDFSATGDTMLTDYILPVSASGNGIITRAGLTAVIAGSPFKTYDGTSAATLTADDFRLVGFVEGQGATVTQTDGTYDSAHAGLSVGVSATLAAGDFTADPDTLLSNYDLPTLAEGFGMIDRKGLTVSIIGNPVKTYDGTTLANLTPANFFFDGFVAGEGATVSQTIGSYDAADPGPRAVSATLSPGDMAGQGTTDLSNYSLPEFAQGNGTIVTRSITPPDLKVADPFPTTPLGDPAGPTDVLQVINTETTQQILDEINAGANFCREFVQQEYAIDCLSDRLQSVADGLSGSGEYSEVRAALEDAARKLHELAIDNASAALVQSVMRGGGRSSSRPLTGISADSLLTANAEARAIIEATQVVLLRSGSDSARRRVAFQEVGQIVGSTATLLRSS